MLTRIMWQRHLCRVLRRRLSSSFPPVGPLHGVRVVDFSRVLAGPYASQILGDMGAEVIKVESMQGDDTRKWGPPWAEGGESAYFISLNRNKLSITVDMKHPDCNKIIEKLIKRSDVLIENFISGTAEKLGVGYEQASRLNERLVYCSVTGFGTTGVYSKRPGYDAICSAMYGMMHITGEEGGRPVKPGVAVTDVLTGLLAHGAILSALYERTISGRGQRVDTSLMEAQLSSLVNVASNYLISGKDTSKRLGTGHPSIVPYQSFECKGGKYISLAVGNDGQFRDFCKALGHTEWAEDVRFLTNADRVRHRGVLIEMLGDIFMSENVEYWLNAFENKGFPCGPVRSIEEAFSCPQALERNMMEEIDHPKCGPIKVVGVPVKYSRTPCSIRTPPPLLGEHTKHVLMDILEFSEAEVMEFLENGVVSTTSSGQ